MLSPRWRKMLSDIRISKGRLIMMVLAIAVGIFGVATITSAYSILTREISRNYLNTNPAAALIEVDKADEALVKSVRQRPGIADAEAGSTVLARVEVKPGQWKPLLLFVIKDFPANRINTFQSQSGAWPPPEGSILMERLALPLTNAKVGDSLRVQSPRGSKGKVAISGLVHDPGLAPAWQEGMVYGYTTPATLASLGESSTLQTLKITVKNQTMNTTAIEGTVSDLAQWLRQQGHTVGEIRIPPPGMHPHQSQMTAILVMLLIFSLMALVLSAILIATMINGLLAQQVRQIGIMKAIGARSSQITGMYLVLIILIGATATLLGLPPGIAMGRNLSEAIAEMLNLTLYSVAIPGWVYLMQLLVGLLVPILVAILPILQSSRTTVREVINNYGVSRKVFGSRLLDKFLGKIRGLDRTLVLALRNTFRRRGRLILTIGLLAAAGGMFMTSLNVKTAWDDSLKKASATRHYDLEIRLDRPVPEKTVKDIMNRVPGVQKTESWNMTPVAMNRSDGLNIVRTYPDGGHGSFTLRSTPPESKMSTSPILLGRRLEQGDKNAVVLNHMASALFSKTKVGDTVTLNINGHPAKLQVVGILREMITPATAYVTPDTFATLTNQPGQTNTMRILMTAHDTNSRKAVTKDIEDTLEKANISPKMNISENMLDEAISGHIFIFIFALIMISVIMAVTGTLGLVSTMGTNVTERTREFGIMRAIGGRSSTIIRNVILEGVFIGLMSWALGFMLSLPLSVAVGNMIGNLSFKAPLPFVISPLAVIIWLAIIVLGTITASAYPGWKASKLTIRETLAYL